MFLPPILVNLQPIFYISAASSFHSAGKRKRREGCAEKGRGEGGWHNSPTCILLSPSVIHAIPPSAVTFLLLYSFHSPYQHFFPFATTQLLYSSCNHTMLFSQRPLPCQSTHFPTPGFAGSMEALCCTITICFTRYCIHVSCQVSYHHIKHPPSSPFLLIFFSVALLPNKAKPCSFSNYYFYILYVFIYNHRNIILFVLFVGFEVIIFSLDIPHFVLI